MTERLECTLEYKGFTFNLSSELFPFADSVEELENKFKSVFDRCEDEIIKSTIRGPVPSTRVISAVINWKQYFVQNRTHRGEEKLNDYVKILVALGVLSFEKQQNWFVISCGINVNPRLRDMWQVYFTSKENAIAYAKASSWAIDYVAQFGEVEYIK